MLQTLDAIRENKASGKALAGEVERITKRMNKADSGALGYDELCQSARSRRYEIAHQQATLKQELGKLMLSFERYAREWAVCLTNACKNWEHDVEFYNASADLERHGSELKVYVGKPMSRKFTGGLIRAIGELGMIGRTGKVERAASLREINRCVTALEQAVDFAGEQGIILHKDTHFTLGAGRDTLAGINDNGSKAA